LINLMRRNECHNQEFPKESLRRLPSPPVVHKNSPLIAPTVSLPVTPQDELLISPEPNIVQNHEVPEKQETQNLQHKESIDEESSEPSQSNDTQSSKTVKAVFNFEGQGDELSFEKGQQITILKVMNDGWCLGETNGSRGIFPANYVKEVGATDPNKNQEEKTPKISTSKSITLDFDNHSPRCDSPRTEDTFGHPSNQTQSRSAFSYIPEMPPAGFVGLKKVQKEEETKDQTPKETVGSCRECGCNDYSQNVFKRDSCNNCFHFH
jgi:hypothetical protein